MPRKDQIHDAVKNALIKDGWTITDDPFRIVYADTDVYADLRIVKTVAGTRGGHPVDKLTHYRSLIKQALTERADLMRSQPLPGEEVICLLDEATDNYLLLRTGWLQGKRLYSTTLHLRLVHDKIHIEQDWTDDFLAELIAAGLPRTDVVLAFTPPETRANTEFAIA